MSETGRVESEKSWEASSVFPSLFFNYLLFIERTPCHVWGAKRSPFFPWLKTSRLFLKAVSVSVMVSLPVGQRLLVFLNASCKTDGPLFMLETHFWIEGVSAWGIFRLNVWTADKGLPFLTTCFGVFQGFAAFSHIQTDFGTDTLILPCSPVVNRMITMHIPLSAHSVAPTLAPERCSENSDYIHTQLLFLCFWKTSISSHTSLPEAHRRLCADSRGKINSTIWLWLWKCKTAYFNGLSCQLLWSGRGLGVESGAPIVKFKGLM